MSWLTRYATSAALAEAILDAGGEIRGDSAVLYHMTDPEIAEKIVREQEMFGEEDGIFFSTKPFGQGGYGDAAVRTLVPLRLLEIDDDFGDELHLRMPVRPGDRISVRAEGVV